jgi:hypothetical protein
MDAIQRPELAGSRDGVEQRAQSLVESHAHFVGRARLFEFQYEEDVLIVRGCVPTYYLKQILQSALKGLEGVRIDNQVMVASSFETDVTSRGVDLC